MSTAKVYIKGFAILNETSRNTNDHQSDPAILDVDDCLVITFEDLPASMQYKRITSESSIAVYVSKIVDPEATSLGPAANLVFEDLAAPVDVETITYNNNQRVLERFSGNSGEKVRNGGWVTDDSISAGLALNCGAAVRQWYVDVSAYIRTTGSLRPYLTVEVDDSETVGVTIRNCTPASGSISKKQDNRFSWLALGSSLTYPEVVQASAVFRWRAGDSGSIHEISVAGESLSVTVPANTFTADEIQWQVAVTANSGIVTTSEWMALSTLDVKPEAKVISPQNTIVDASADNLFMWEHIISTGTAQSKAELQKSVDGETWETLATVIGAETQWKCQAGTITSSVKYWRVRTYNADSVASDWSDAAQIVVISAPPTPIVQILTAGAKPAVSWQTSGQQAAQVEVIGIYESGTIYGTVQQWSAPMYLDDGNYTIRVRVQNEYGLWSEWGDAALQVVNTPGAAILLSARTSHIATLEWDTTGNYDFFLIYRNGKPVARTVQRAYSDLLSIGPVTYQVRGCYTSSGNYGISNETSVVVAPQTTMLLDMETREWLQLPYAASQNRKTSRERTRSVSYLTLSGVKYPYAEVSDNYTDALTIECAVVDAEGTRKIEALLGKLVCAKTKTGDMVIGYLDVLQKDHDGIITTFSFTVQQIDYNEEVQL